MIHFYLLHNSIVRWHVIVTLCSSFVAIPAFSQPTLAYQTVVTGLSKPVNITNAGDNSGRLFIVEQTGTIRILSGGGLLPTPFLDISDRTASAVGELGLLNIVFDPAYATNGFFYVYYVDQSYSSTLARFSVSSGNPNIADTTSEKILFKIIKTDHNHYGSGMHFSSDGYLYISTGDGGIDGDPTMTAQDGQTLLGKMLRINVSNVNTPPYYNVPADNPYVTNPGLLPEIWDIGLRNPWRWSFDRQTHDMWIADVGRGQREEVNFIPANATKGVNFGWNCYEGTLTNSTTGCQPLSSYTSPIFEYPHDPAIGGYAVTGGFVYRGPDFPGLTGYYICADYSSGNVWKIKYNGASWDVSQQSGLSKYIASFGEGSDGTLYAVYQTATEGSIFKVVVPVALPVTLLNFSGQADKGIISLKWETSLEQHLGQFQVEYNDHDAGFKTVGNVPAHHNATGSVYHYEHKAANDGKLLYRLKMIDQDGSFTYSPIISVQVDINAKDVIYFTVITNGVLSLYNNANSFTTIELGNLQGAVVLKQNIASRRGRIDIRLPSLASGIYVVRLQGGDKVLTQRVFIQ